MLEGSVAVSLLVVAVVELIARIQAKDKRAALKIVIAGVIGGLAGYIGVEGLNVTSGIVAGLDAAGVITASTRIGTFVKK